MIGRLTAATLVATAAPALANDDAATAIAPVRFGGLGPDGRAELAAEAMLGIPEDGDASVGMLVECQYAPASGLGGYVRVYYGGADDRPSFSNFELGALYRVDRGAVALAVRGGVVMPTGDDHAETPQSAAVVRRPADLVLGGIPAVALRVSAAPSYRRGNVVLRGDVGLDLVDDSDRGVDLVRDADDDPEVLYHVDLAAGFTRGRGAVMLQTSAVGHAVHDRLSQAIALGGEYDLGKVRVTATVARPVFSGVAAIGAIAFGISAPL